MKKRIIEDIVPPTPRRSIRDVDLPSQRNRLPKITRVTPSENINTPRSTPESNAHTKESPQPITNTESTLERPKQPTLNTYPSENRGTQTPLRIPSTESVNKYSKNITRIASLGGFVVAVALVYFLYLFLHVGAEVTVTPKSKVVGFKATYAAKKNPGVNDLLFTVLSLEETGEKTVPSTGEKSVERRATGTVMLYNETKISQRLVKNTRLETNDGRIYRLDNSVVLPGAKGSTPGSVAVTVSADTAGDDYNIGLSDFTIPGFKGDPRFKTMYGRSKTVMSGGMKGIIKTASAQDIEAGETDLKSSLKAKLINKAKEQVPAGFILYDNAVYLTYDMLSKPEDTTISIKASLHGILFKKDDLATFIAKNNLPDYNGDPLTSTTLSNLSFAPDSLETAPWNSGNLPFTLQGTTTLIWLYDSAKLAKDLAGVPQNKVSEIFKNYSGIERAEVSIRPAWKSTLPEDSSKIEVVNRDNVLK